MKEGHLCSFCIAVWLAVFAFESSAETQRVYLDFTTGSDGSINYTSAIRSAIQSDLEGKYSAYWDIEFYQSPPACPYSRLRFNAGSPGGIADHVDFRNLVPDDSAVVNIDGVNGLSTSSSFIDTVRSSATIGAHELGHLLGIRHADSYGPIGTGLGNPGPGPGAYLPAFPGPSNGDETNDHVMATPAFGATNLLRDTFLSERSATKVEFAFDGTAVNEADGSKNSLASAQPIAFANMTVPNTIRTGQRAALGAFSVDAISVIGSIDSSNEEDYYGFSAAAGDLFNFEVMSAAIDQRVSEFDTQISMFDSGGSLVEYWNGTAFNDDEYESLDSILIDITIPADGDYFIRVNSYNNASSGEYELFGYRFNGEATNLVDADFDDNGTYDCRDIDALVSRIAGQSNDASYDLTGDGRVDSDDLDAWLAEAGSANLSPGTSYLRGDANLDGAVDASDFNLWNNHKFSFNSAWCVGDFNADGAVDTGDFNIWNTNKFRLADRSTAQAVPEPGTSLLLVFGLLLGLSPFAPRR